MDNLCKQCGAPLKEGALNCEYCGAATGVQPQQAQQPTVQTVYIQQDPIAAEKAMWPVKSKIVAAILALLFGGLGIHYFYLGKAGKGVLSIIFCWTYLPAIIGFIQGIIMLCSNDENFELKYHCRIK